MSKALCPGFPEFGFGSNCFISGRRGAGRGEGLFLGDVGNAVLEGARRAVRRCVCVCLSSGWNRFREQNPKTGNELQFFKEQKGNLEQK